MNAYQIYDSAFSSENHTNTYDFIEDYAQNALNIALSRNVIMEILTCRFAWLACVEKSGGSGDDFYHLVQKPLEDIEL